MSQDLCRYVLVTPARNEEKYLARTLDSVIAQTIRPVRWVIVSDGSTDRTDEIVREYAANNSFIILISLKNAEARSFASKAIAFRQGWDAIGNVDYDFIGILDADVEFGPAYFARMLAELRDKPNLGVVGGALEELVRGRLRMTLSGRHHVAGAFQLFRRECFEVIGGYPQVKVAGEDSIALIMARMNGWETQMIPEEKVLHLKAYSTSLRRSLKVRFNEGRTDYNLGLGPVFCITKGLYRAWREKPFLLATLARMSGYLLALLRSQERDVSKEVMKYYRREQWGRFRARLCRGIRSEV